MINATVLADLRDYYGLEKRLPKINDMSTMTAFVEPDLADCMGCDVQRLYNYGDTYGHINKDWKEWLENHKYHFHDKMHQIQNI